MKRSLGVKLGREALACSGVVWLALAARPGGARRQPRGRADGEEGQRAREAARGHWRGAQPAVLGGATGRLAVRK